MLVEGKGVSYQLRRGCAEANREEGNAMLVLSRRAGESLKIGDNITVTVLGFKGLQVRLGITAPGNTTIHREEVFFRIKAALAAEQKDELS